MTKETPKTKPRRCDYSYPGDWYTHLYTEDEKRILKESFSNIVEILLGKSAWASDKNGNLTRTSNKEYDKLVGYSLDDALSLVESLGFKAAICVIKKNPENPLFDYEGASFVMQSMHVGCITLYINEGESTVCRVRYG